MRRLLVGMVLGALAVAGVPALATHITEPTHPINHISMFVGHYASGTSVGPCTNGAIGRWPDGFVRLRANMYVFADSRKDGAPSEHFDVEVRHNWPFPIEGPDAWEPTAGMVQEQAWDHQNIPPHGARAYRANRLDIGNVFRFPGIHRISFIVDGNESENHHEIACVFEVPDID